MVRYKVSVSVGGGVDSLTSCCISIWKSAETTEDEFQFLIRN